jgi:polyhydroxyalkanoate synthesis regulator phasin
MNEAEKERILTLVAEGTLRPAEATRLLAAIAALEEKPAETKAEAAQEDEQKQPTVEFKLQRPDGTHTVVQVPASLFPMLIQVLKVAAKESLRSAGQDIVAGTKVIVRRKVKDIKKRARSIIDGRPDTSAAASEETTEAEHEARRRILQMVQNGRITADEASRLIREIDAIEARGG